MVVGAKCCGNVSPVQGLGNLSSLRRTDGVKNRESLGKNLKKKPQQNRFGKSYSSKTLTPNVKLHLKGEKFYFERKGVRFIYNVFSTYYMRMIAKLKCLIFNIRAFISSHIVTATQFT